MEIIWSRCCFGGGDDGGDGDGDDCRVGSRNALAMDGKDLVRCKTRLRRGCGNKDCSCEDDCDCHHLLEYQQQQHPLLRMICL